MTVAIMSPSDQVRARGEALRGFAETRLNEGLETRDQRGCLDPVDWRARWTEVADQGVFRIGLPAATGGDGTDLAEAAFLLHQIGRGCRDNGLLLAISAQVWTVIRPILEFGSAEQKARYLPRILSGDWFGADAITELNSGSDAMALETTARRDGDGYILTGQKAFIGMAPDCDFALIFAKTNPDAGAWGVSAFVVDADTPGFLRGAEMDKAGLRTIPTGYLGFEEMRVPETDRLGAEGAGAAIFNRSGEWERQMIFAAHVGAMERQLADCLEYSGRREVFGQPIGQHQTIANRLADMRLRLETCRMMQARAAMQMQARSSNALEAALTKLHISEAILASSLDAVRIMGGQGCLWDTDAARDLRDAVPGVIYGGTSDIQRNIIASFQARAGL